MLDPTPPPPISPMREALLALTLPALQPLSSTAIAPLILPVLRLHLTESLPLHATLIQHFRDRARTAPPSPSDPILSTLLSALSPPDDLLAKATINYILIDLPTTLLRVFRPALADLASSHHDAARSARSALRVLARETWTPESKFNEWAVRSLRENVAAAEEMMPHVEGLLAWMQDGHWPVFMGCKELVLRWPGVGVDAVRGVLRDGRDGEWSYYLVRHVVWEWGWESRARVRGELGRIAERPTEEEREWELHEVCREVLEGMGGATDTDVTW